MDENIFGPQEAGFSQAPMAFDIKNVLNNNTETPTEIEGGVNEGGKELLGYFIQDVGAGMTKEQARGTYPEFGEDYIDDLFSDAKSNGNIEAIYNAYPELQTINQEEVGEDIGTPEYITKTEEKEINKEAGNLHNLAAGAATGLIETAGLIGSAGTFAVDSLPSVDSSSNLLGLLPPSEAEKISRALSFKGMYDALRTEDKASIDKLIPKDNETGENFTGVMGPLNYSTQIKDAAQKELGANPDSGWTTTGEFLTPDTWLGVGALMKGGIKLVPKVINGARTNIGDIGEYLVKLSGGLRKEGLELDINLLKSNPKLALEKSGITPEEVIGMLDEVIKQLPANAKKELAEIERFKSELTSTVLQKQATNIDDAARLGEEVSVTLGKTAEQAKENLAKQANELQLTGVGYEKFVGKEAGITSESLSKNFIQRLKDSDALMGTEGKQALKVVQDEIDIVVEAVSKRDGIFRYEDLHKLRKNIDDKINWGDATASAKNKFIKKFRRIFDEDIMEANFDGLKTVDEKYATKIKEIEEMQKVFGKGGEESNAFRKKLLSLHKLGNDKELGEVAKLLGIDPVELKTLSKDLADDAIDAGKKFNVDSTINKIDGVSDIKSLENIGETLGGQNLKELKSLSKENEYLKGFVSAIEADKLATKNTGENLLATIYKAMDVKKGTEAGNKATGALSYLEKKLGSEKFKELQLIKSIYKIKNTPNEGTFASLIFNLAPLKIPLLGPVLKKYVGTPEQALEFVLKRANRVDARRIKALESSMKNGKSLISKEVAEFGELLMKYDFGAKVTGKTLNEE